MHYKVNILYFSIKILCFKPTEEPGIVAQAKIHVPPPRTMPYLANLLTVCPTRCISFLQGYRDLAGAIKKHKSTDETKTIYYENKKKFKHTCLHI